MTQTMLERAARAAAESYQDGYSAYLDFDRGDGTTVRQGGMFLDMKIIARAVLMAVRVPSEAMSQAVRTTEGWEDMIDFVLNEGEK